jgi:hypothetical protein
MGFLWAPALMLFSGEFWEYAAFPFGVFLLFSLALRWMAARAAPVFSRRFFPLLYPLVALISVIPAVVAVQFGPALESWLGGGDTYALAGVILNLVSYFYLNVAISLLWLAVDRLRKDVA